MSKKSALEYLNSKPNVKVTTTKMKNPPRPVYVGDPDWGDSLLGIMSYCASQGIATDIEELDYVLEMDTSTGIPKGRITLVYGDHNLKSGFIDHLKTKAKDFVEVYPGEIPEEGNVNAYGEELVILKLREKCYPEHPQKFYHNLTESLPFETALILDSNFNKPADFHEFDKSQCIRAFSSLHLYFFRNEKGLASLKLIKSKINRFQGHTVQFDPDEFE